MTNPAPHPSVRDLLEEKVRCYNQPQFIEDDPVQIPHLFGSRPNIEIAGFLAASMAWGQRKTIIASARRLVAMMDDDPFDFLMNAQEGDFKTFLDFRHRTFGGNDCVFFLKSLARIYREGGGLARIFEDGYAKKWTIRESLTEFRSVFLSDGPPESIARHVSDVQKNSAAKRLNMFLRWMVRKDSNGVDFGIWKGIPPSALCIPLDVHTGAVARKLGLLQRAADDWKAVTELTGVLRQFDPDDPVKYDFALFGLGMYEGF